MANKAETQLWLRANIVPLIRKVDNLDGSTKTKLRPIALLETLLKLIESVAVDQRADPHQNTDAGIAGGIQGQRRSGGDEQRSEKLLGD